MRMLKQAVLLPVILSFGLAISGYALAAEPAPKASLFTFKPPLRGAPASRIGGGSRGVSDQEASLSVLAPEQTGFTTVASPVLYWYVSKDVQMPVEVTLIDDNSDDPLFEKIIPSVKAGIHKFDLAEHGIKLQEGVEYSWHVAVILDSTHRSNDILSGANVKYNRPSAEMTGQLAKADKTLRPGIFAAGGIWYDAISALSDQIDADPKNRALRGGRAALLEQVGLGDAATMDRQQEKNVNNN